MIGGVPWTAAVECLYVVNGAPVAVNEGGIEALVAVALARGPVSEVRIRCPEAIRGNAAGTDNFPETHEAFATRGIVGEQRDCRSRVRIFCPDVKSHQRIGGTTG